MVSPNNIHSLYNTFDLMAPQPPASSPASTHVRDSCEFFPEGYVPGAWDVICQRGKDCHEHVGNRRFRACVDTFVDAYTQSKTRQEKSMVISSIVKAVKNNAGGNGGFVMKDTRTQRWHHVDSKVARDKVGNALRDAIKQRQESKLQPQRNSSLAWMNSCNSASGNNSGIPMSSFPFEAISQNQPEHSGSQVVDFCTNPSSHQNLASVFGSSFMSADSSHMDDMKSLFRMNQMLPDRMEPDTLHNLQGNSMNGMPIMSQMNQIDQQTLSTRMCIEALAESMDTDEFDDLEPRPIQPFR
eukprot:Nitzschia sp. Nitz4//scaffold348_size17284//2269//3303//NITZ4_008840-RA/size17284-snap-gene-0.19-mRNA-1//1//CDS//3329548682//5124//frame0